MIALITEIISRFGPRVAGTDAEENAQYFIADKCREFTADVQVIPFEEYLDARFGKLRYYVALFFMALALYWWWPVVALVVAAINTFFLIFDLMSYRDILTNFPGKKQTSHNVVATLEPQGEVKSTLLVSAHMDSTREYTWWYRFGEAGVKMTVAAGVVMLLQFLFLLWHVLSPASYHHYLWILLLLASPITIVYWSMHADNGVDGAQDNLSGVAIGFDVFKHFASVHGKSSLQNTRIQFVSFGSEERGLCGSRNYVQHNLEKLRHQKAHVVNIDSVRPENEITILEREIMNGSRHNAAMVQQMQSAFSAKSIAHKTATLPIGGTDAVPFTRADIPAFTIIGISAKEYDFTYHTRHDKVEHIEPRSLEKVRDGIIQFITTWDNR